MEEKNGNTACNHRAVLTISGCGISEEKEFKLDCMNNGDITYGMFAAWYKAVKAYASGNVTDEREALRGFVKACSGK